MNSANTEIQSRGHGYVPPATTSCINGTSGRALHVAGDATLLDRPAVAVVGSRRASRDGLACAAQVSAELVARGYVVLSGLAAGIDRAAHEAAIRAGGRTIAVVGTPLESVYPCEHARLQEHVYREHLLLSPFPTGSKMAPWHFPARNRVMATLALATVLIEATVQSGTRHQVQECFALGKRVYVRRSLVGSLSWLREARRADFVEWSDANELGELLSRGGVRGERALS